MNFLAQGPLPWFVAGPAIGFMVPAFSLIANKQFGFSSNLRHLCAALAPGKVSFFQYDWKKQGLWNLMFLLGATLGGLLAFRCGAGHVMVSAQTAASLHQLGLHDLSGPVPREIFSWASLLTWRGFLSLVGGGLLVGFGAAWAGGCTSGHAISGLADFQLPSLLAVLGFFAGGLLTTFLLLPHLL